MLVKFSIIILTAGITFMNEKIGDYLLDISKLVFAGVVLSTILDLEVSKISVLFFGIYASFTFALMGFLLFRRK